MYSILAMSKESVFLSVNKVNLLVGGLNDQLFHQQQPEHINKVRRCHVIYNYLLLKQFAITFILVCIRVCRATCQNEIYGAVWLKL